MNEIIPDKYTRVTQILYPFSGLSAIDPRIVQNAGERGTRVHNICEAIVAGVGVWDIPDDIAGYISSFQQWWKDQKVIAVEERFFCDEFLITGKVDMIIETENGLAIFDLKTSYKPSKTWPLQGSAYMHMARKANYDIKLIQFLHLKKDGSKPTLHEYQDQFDLFKKCLDVYRYFY